MAEISIADVLSLKPAKRLEIAELLWDSLEETPESIPLRDDQKVELDRRLKYYYEHKEESLSWGVVKEQIRSLK